MAEKKETISLQEVIDTIVQKIRTEKIYLLGSAALAAGQSKPSMQLLILTPLEEDRHEEKLLSLLAEAFHDRLSLTAIIFSVTIFNNWLDSGNLLSHHLYHAHRPVYDAQKVRLRTPGNYSLKDIQRKVVQEYSTWSFKAIQLKLAADSLQARAQFELATFLLHQAAELTLTAMIRLATGYNPRNHDLIRLFALANTFIGKQVAVFDMPDQEDRRLCYLLNRAYVLSRYKLNYRVSEREYAILKERVEKLLLVPEFSHAIRLRLLSFFNAPGHVLG